MQRVYDARLRVPIVERRWIDVVDAARTFFEHLTAVGWTALGIALGLHVARLAARSLAWRNIIVAAYPGTRVSPLRIFGAYVAGVGRQLARSRTGRATGSSSCSSSGRPREHVYDADAHALRRDALRHRRAAVDPRLGAVAGPAAVTRRPPGPRRDRLVLAPSPPHPGGVIAVVWTAVIVLLSSSGETGQATSGSASATASRSCGRRAATCGSSFPGKPSRGCFRVATIYFFLEAFHVPRARRGTRCSCWPSRASPR